LNTDKLKIFLFVCWWTGASAMLFTILYPELSFLLR
jgi:hypothetical protein